MRRRDFIARVAGTAAGWPIAARAQQTPHRLAFVHSGVPADKLTESAGPFWVRRVYQTLRELGDVEGSNLVVERFSAEGRAERFASLAAEVVSRKPDVILLNLNDLAKAFMVATSTIPLVVIVGDPVAGGLLTNLGRPGGNLTGASVNAGIEIYAKRLQLLKEAAPKTAKVAALMSSAWMGADGMSAYREAAQKLGIELVARELPEVNDMRLRGAYEEMAQQHFDAAVVDEGGTFLAQRALLVELAAKHRLPVIYPYRDYVELGGLVAYAPDLGELAQRLASDVHQIFNGTKAGDIPFYLPNKFQLIVNSKAAKALGLELPPSLLTRADEMIE
jgi:putative tryptophan/tyrosine transport system substrate-binding protein